MKLTLRANKLGEKLLLLSTAFVLAVSTLTASMPFILSSNVSAQTPEQCAAEFNAASQRCVRTLAELQAALAELSVSEIVLNATITTPSTIVINRPVKLNGHDERIVLADNTSGWNADGRNYVLQAYNTTGVTLNSVQLEGADAGLLVNGSEVTLTGNMRFIGHEFGNIELSKGQGVTRAPKLNIPNANSLNGNTNESTSKPYVWVDTNSVNDALVSSPYLYKGVNRSAQNPGQLWYFANVNNTGVVADIVQTGAVFDSVQKAVDAATTRQTVRMQKDVTLTDSAIRIEKSINFDGNGKTITAQFARGTSGGVNNVALAVVTDNVTVQNVTTVSTYTANPAHGIVVQGSNHISGIVLRNVTTHNATAGFIINNATATIDTVSTNGSLWYGIGIDLGGSVTVTGTNTHTEAVAIKTENTRGTVNTVNYTAGQYVKIAELSKITGRTAYALASAVPVAAVTANGMGTGAFVSDREATEPVVIRGSANGTFTMKSHWFDITAPNGTHYYWANMNTSSPDVAFNLSQVSGLPLDSKGRAKPGQYTIRYVATDINKLRNDDRAPATITVTVDNAKPQVTATISSQYVVSNNNLPTLTIIATDDSGIKDVQYEILRADDLGGRAIVGWTSVAGQTNVPLTVLSTIPDGSYVIRVRAFDNADNKQSGVDVPFTINRTLSSSLSVSSTASATPSVNGVAYYANDIPAVGEELVVTVDETSYPVTTGANGVWQIPVIVENGTHTVVVSRANTQIAVLEFTTLVPTVPVNPGANTGDDVEENDEEEELTTETTTSVVGALNNGVPFANFGAAGVLGLNNSVDTPSSDVDAEANDEDVRGVSTLDTVAQAVDADNTDGKAMGLAWYWWLLIAAAVALIGWWIAAAIRNRQADQ